MTAQVAVAPDGQTTVEEQLVKSRHRVKTYGEVPDTARRNSPELLIEIPHLSTRVAG